MNLYENKIVLAPMVRAGRTPLRVLSLRYGADLVYTEEIIDQKLLGCQRIVNESLGTIDYRLGDEIILRIAPEEKGKVILQIGTNNGENAAKVVEKIGEDVAGIDVNMGCPKPFSIHCGMGAALLAHTDKITNILRSMTAIAKIPVSCKIRLLDEPEKTIELVKEIEKCGVAALGVHGRRKEERNPDPPRINEIKEVTSTVKSIPVITNGISAETETYADLDRWRTETGASSVMIARRALEKPSIFRKEGLLSKEEEIRNFLNVACEFDDGYTTTKYVIQRILGSDQEHDPRGRQTVVAGSILEICRAWDVEDVYEKWRNERKRKAIKRKIEVSENGTITVDVSFPLKKLKDAQKRAATPKEVIFTYCADKKLPKPSYETSHRKEDHRYVSIISVDGKRYQSSYGQVNIKMAEQVAALAALIALDLRSRLKGDWEELV